MGTVPASATAAAPKMFEALKRVGLVLSGLPLTQKNDELWGAFSAVISAIADAAGDLDSELSKAIDEDLAREELPV